MNTRLYACTLSIGIMLAVMAGCTHGKLHGPGSSNDAPSTPSLVASDGTSVTPEELVGQAGRVAYILIGEGHTNLCDHKAHAAILAELLRGGIMPVVGLEMVSKDMQPVLDQWNAGEISLDQIEDALEWKDGWGYPFTFYEPIFRLSRQYGLPMAALNVPRRVVDTVRTQGLESLSVSEREFVPDPIIPATESQKKALEETLSMHAQMAGHASKMVETFFLVQSLWDTAMATEARAWREKSGKPVVIFAGAGHVENRWGIAARLGVLDPGAQILSILPARGTNDITQEGADLYFLCPAKHRTRLGIVLESGDKGLVVKAVEPGSRAEKSGLRAGDILVETNGQKLTEPMDLHKAAVPVVREGKPLVMRVLRDGKEREIVIDMGK